MLEAACRGTVKMGLGEVLPTLWKGVNGRRRKHTPLLSPGSFPSLQLVPQDPPPSRSSSQALPSERAC